MADPALLLCYQTANVYKGDMDTLKQGAWLNDNIIAFYMDYLQHDKFSSAAARFRFVSPGTTFILMHDDDPSDFADTFEGCDVLPETELVFFPLNNNTSVTRAGGSHWTLLVLDVPRARLLSFDSIRGSNDAAAKKLAKALAPLLPKLKAASTVRLADDEEDADDGAASAAASSSSKKKGALNVSLSAPPSAPQQLNGSDCGVYTLMVAEVLAQVRQDNGGEGAQPPLDGEEAASKLHALVTPKAVAQKREDIKAIIQRKAKEGKVQ